MDPSGSGSGSGSNPEPTPDVLDPPPTIQTYFSEHMDRAAQQVHDLLEQLDTIVIEPESEEERIFETLAPRIHELVLMMTSEEHPTSYLKPIMDNMRAHAEYQAAAARHARDDASARQLREWIPDAVAGVEKWRTAYERFGEKVKPLPKLELRNTIRRSDY